MKELHNHIFSNTTCISKETMLRYINKQLSKEELYEVEKHMLDCELCSEAYDGIKFAQNSSMLFAIDNQIDQRVGLGNTKAPIMRNLMVAASVLVLVFGAYFTLSYFNSTISNDTEMAILEDKEQKLLETPKKVDVLTKEIESNKQKEDELVEKEFAAEYGYVGDLSGNEPIEEEISLAENEVVMLDDEIDYVAEEVTVTANIKREKSYKTLETEKILVVEESKKIAPKKDRRSDNNRVEAEASGEYLADEEVSPTLVSGKVGEALKKSKNKKSSSKFKTRNVEQAPAFSEDQPSELANASKSKSQLSTVTINALKVVDYTQEYQKEYDLKKANKVISNSVGAGFEGKADKDKEEAEVKESTVEITYRATLEKAIGHYKNGQYAQALTTFDVILKTHPDEVNGQFYQGLSNYELQRYPQALGKLNQVLMNEKTAFNEEASWYKALTLIEMQQNDKAKKVLNAIVQGNGFYKTKATEKLKTLN